MWIVKGKIRTGIMGMVFPAEVRESFVAHLRSRFPEQDKGVQVGGMTTYKVKEADSQAIYITFFHRKFILWEEKFTHKDCQVESLVTDMRCQMESYYKDILKEIFPPNVVADESYSMIGFVFGEHFSIIPPKKKFRSFLSKNEDAAENEKYRLFGDGIATFNYKIYRGFMFWKNVGLVRVSRHLVMCCGLDDFFKQEVVNLCYEFVLNKRPGKSDDEGIHSLMAGLSRYTVPSDESFFLQVLVMKVTVAIGIISMGGNFVYSLPHMPIGMKIIISLCLVVSTIFLFPILDFLLIHKRQI